MRAYLSLNDNYTARMPSRPDPWYTNRYVVDVDEVERSATRVRLPGPSTEESTSSSSPWGETRRGDLQIDFVMQGNAQMIIDWHDAVTDDDEDDALKDVVITLLDEDGDEVWEWTFTDCWLKRYEPPTLDATTDDVVAMKQVTLAYDSVSSESL